MPQLKLAAVIDPPEMLKVKKDSTLPMLKAAEDKGWQIFVVLQSDLSIENGRAYAKTRSLKIDFSAPLWYQLGEKIEQPLSEFHLILMRKDPPFDMNYIYSTYVLEAAEREGVWVINQPAALRSANEKVFISLFPACIAPTLYSMDQIKLKQFVKQQRRAVLKPLSGMGGKSVFMVTDGDLNLNVILETLTKEGTEMITAQKYLPEIASGDKRILLIDGVPQPYGLARIPVGDDPRGNLAAGGRGEVFKLTERDYWLCGQIAPKLRQMGLFFVGIDVIGDYITEINVTSPTCIREIEAGTDLTIARDFIEAVEKKWRKNQKSTPDFF